VALQRSYAPEVVDGGSRENYARLILINRRPPARPFFVKLVAGLSLRRERRRAPRAKARRHQALHRTGRARRSRSLHGENEGKVAEIRSCLFESLDPVDSDYRRDRLAMSFEDDVTFGNRGDETRHASACCFRDAHAKIDRGHISTIQISI